MKTADITAVAIGTSRAKVERARVVLANPDEASAVRKGEKTIHQAAKDAMTRRTAPSSPKTKPRRQSKATAMTERTL